MTRDFPGGDFDRWLSEPYDTDQYGSHEPEPEPEDAENPYDYDFDNLAALIDAGLLPEARP